MSANATTYIPTFGASATRAPDLPPLPLANITGWSASAGTIVAGFTSSQFPSSASRRVLGSDGPTAAAPITLNNSGMASWTGSVELTTAAGPSWVATARRGALTWDATGRALVYAGGAVVSDGNQPVFGTTLRLGHESASANFLNGCLTSLDIYSRRLPNSRLQELTA